MAEKGGEKELEEEGRLMVGKKNQKKIKWIRGSWEEVAPNKGRSVPWEGQFCILYVPHSALSSVLKMETSDFPEMLVMIYQTPRCHSQKTLIFLVTTLRTSNLTMAYIFIQLSMWSVSAQEANGQWNNSVKLNNVESWISLQVFHAKSTDFARCLWQLIF
jgi:hypothetical protein